jgi:hypothetical protein
MSTSTRTGNLYFVLREGSTHEEQWSWADIEGLCRSGELTARARIFLPDEDRWAALGETRLAEALTGKHASGDEDEPSPEPGARLEEDYKSALERLSEDPDLLEARLDAAILASELGLREEARAQFQSVLHSHPFHARAAQEVRRRFSKMEQRSFRYLERPAPAWDDLGELAGMPFARGPLYVVVPAAVMALVTCLPAGGLLCALLAFLWAFQVMEYTARGATKPAGWNRSFKDPWRKLLRPVLLMGIVAGQWTLVLAGGAKLAMLAQGQGAASMGTFMAKSPVFLVIASITGLLYFPAAMVTIGGFTGPVGKTLDPRRLVRTVARMEHEYVYSVVLVTALVAGVLGARLLFGGIPVAGAAVTGAVLAYATPMAGFILGRLLGRMAHVIE